MKRVMRNADFAMADKQTQKITYPNIDRSSLFFKSMKQNL